MTEKAAGTSLTALLSQAKPKAVVRKSNLVIILKLLTTQTTRSLINSLYLLLNLDRMSKIERLDLIIANYAVHEFHTTTFGPTLEALSKLLAPSAIRDQCHLVGKEFGP